SLLLWGATAAAENVDPVEELRREVRQLKAQVQTLRSAVAEAADLDRVRANALVRALAGDAPASPKETGARPSPAPRTATPQPARRAAVEAVAPVGVIR